MSLYLMHTKCYYHFHPLLEFDNDSANQKVDDDNSLDFFKWQQGILNDQKNLLKENY
jgi:hypothetical protein